MQQLRGEGVVAIGWASGLPTEVGTTRGAAEKRSDCFVAVGGFAINEGSFAPRNDSKMKGKFEDKR
jgi:hypothetical protein